MSKDTPPSQQERQKAQSEIVKALLYIVAPVRKYFKRLFTILGFRKEKVTGHVKIPPSKNSAMLDLRQKEAKEAAEALAAKIAAVEKAATEKFLAGGARPENASRQDYTKPKPPSGT